jgi:dethiobiotin synthetase
MQPIFITGIGTNIGKTVIAAILAEVLEADYWKPVQAGYENGTDSEWVKKVVSNAVTKIHPETYKLHLAASPHIAAREEGLKINLDEIERNFKIIQQKENRPLIIEGAGGLMVPLNENEFVLDLIKKLNAKLIIVSRNYLGSINHSLLTASICKSNNIPVKGWIFNDQYLDYEDEIIRWTGIQRIASVPFITNPGRENIARHAKLLGTEIRKVLGNAEA